MLVIKENSSTKKLFATGTFTLTTEHGVAFTLIGLLCLVVSPIAIFVPYVLQIICGYPAIVSGYITTIPAGVWAIASIAVGGVTGSRVRSLLYAGPWLVFTSYVLLAVTATLAPVNNESIIIPFVCFGTALFGAGMGMCWPHIIAHIMQKAPQGEQDLAASSVPTMELVSEGFGAACAGLIANCAGFCNTQNIYAPLHAITLVFAASCLIPLVALTLIPRVLRYNS